MNSYTNVRPEQDNRDGSVTRTPDKRSIEAALSGQDIAQEQQSLLDLVDKLRSAQLDNVKLPQIVVVGDQSAGKSSILEALTGIPFPRAAGACTRFATEIRLRRAKEDRFSIHIVPDKLNRSSEEQERLKRFGKNVDGSLDFEQLLQAACDQIAPRNIAGRFAARDVLVVEKSGPEMPLLTIVDLPGLVKNPNKEQSIEDINAISDLADRYMKSSRTIILAVVGGNQDYVQAPVLTKARHFDPRGTRTIGVLTKPDLTGSIGLEDKFIALVNNQDEPNRFDLGWYVMLNPGPRELGQEWPSLEKRRQIEADFFQTGKWSTIPLERCGAVALKQKLSVQLQRHIGRHVRALQKEIQKAHNDCLAQLKLLGAGKDTVEEMREELVQLCSESKDLITPAVHGTYTNPIGKLFFKKSVDLKGTPPHKLRARCVVENRNFAQRIRTHGSKSHSFPGFSRGVAGGEALGNSSKRDIARQVVEPLVQQNIGTEFPSDHNPRLVYTLFQDYSENWSDIAQLHKDNVGAICNEFLAEVIDYTWPQRMREPLRQQILNPQVKEILDKAHTELTVLLQDLQYEIQPYDTEYSERLEKWRAAASSESPVTEAEVLLEKMLIYYDLSARTFVNNVITQVIERHLLQGLLKIFSWVNINRLDDQTVLAIAAEDKATRDKRVALKAKKASIEEARNICASLAMRKELRTFDNDELEESEDSSEEGQDRSSSRIQRQRQAPRRRGSQNSLYTPSKSRHQQGYQDQPSQTSSQANYTRNDAASFQYGDNSPVLMEPASEKLPPRPPKTADNHLGQSDPIQRLNDYTINPPHHAPPTPPRSDKGSFDAKAPAFASAPDSNTFKQGQIWQDTPVDQLSQGRAEQNTPRGDQYPRLNADAARISVNNNVPPQPRRPSRRLFG